MPFNMTVSEFRNFLIRGVSSRSSMFFGVLIAVCVLAVGIVFPVHAQDSDSAAKDKRPLVVLPWSKVCPKPQEGESAKCVVIEKLFEPSEGGLVAEVAVHLPEGADPYLLVNVVDGVLIPTGVSLLVDSTKEEDITAENNAKFLICDTGFCLAHLQGGASLIEKFKKGNDLYLVVRLPNRKRFALKMSLGGFTKAYEGSAVEMSAYEAKEKELLAGMRDSSKK